MIHKATNVYKANGGWVKRFGNKILGPFATKLEAENAVDNISKSEATILEQQPKTIEKIAKPNASVKKNDPSCCKK